MSANANVVLLAVLNGDQFYTANGLLNANGTINTYLAGTLTPANTYSDATGGILNPNPIVVNTQGFLSNEIWIPQGTTLRTRVYDNANNLLQDINNIPGVNDFSAIANISYTFTGYLNLSANGQVGFKIPQTVPESQGSALPVNFQYAPGNILRYGTNSTPGNTDMTTAFQAAFNQIAYGGAPVYVPAGQYLTSNTVSLPQSAPFTMYGDGIGQSVITKTGDSDAFQVTNTGSAYNQINIHDLEVTTTTAMSNGSAFTLTGGGLLPSVTVRDVAVFWGSASNFKAAFNLINCSESEFTRCFIYGNTPQSNFGWLVTATQAATVYKFIGCSLYGIGVGAGFLNTTDPGLEGVQFYGCDFTGVNYGVSYNNSYGSSYYPPQLTWVGGHINATTHNFVVANSSQLVIHGAVLYNNGNNSILSLTGVSDLSIIGNDFEQTAGIADGIQISGYSQFNVGMIADNIFRMGSSGSAINLLAAQYCANATIQGNQRTGGTATVSTTGAIPTTCLILDNTPRDVIDIYDTTLTGAATMSLVGIRSDFCLVSAPASNTVCTSLTSRNAWDKVTLDCSSANLTIQHNATNPNGFVLAGGVNYTFPSTGGRLRLEMRNGGYWTEVGRDG